MELNFIEIIPTQSVFFRQVKTPVEILSEPASSFQVWSFNPDHLVENDSEILEYDYEQLSIAGHLRAARQTEMSTTAPAQPGLTRGRYPLVRVRHHRSSMLELVTAGSASAQEIHLTVRPRDGEAVTAVARRAAAELTLRRALAVRILGFGSLAAPNATLAAPRVWAA